MSNLLAVVHRMTQQKHGKLYALVTMMKDKDLEQVFSLFDDKDEVLLTTLSYPRVAKKDDFPIDVQKDIIMKRLSSCFYPAARSLGS